MDRGITDFSVADRLAVVIWGTGRSLSVNFGLGSYLSYRGVYDALDDLRAYGGDYNLEDAIEYAERNVFTGRDGDRSDVADVYLIITDDDPGRNDENGVIRAAESAIDDGKYIDALLITRDATENYFLDVVDRNRHIYQADRFSDLSNYNGVLEVWEDLYPELSGVSVEFGKLFQNIVMEI